MLDEILLNDLYDECMILMHDDDEHLQLEIDETHMIEYDEIEQVLLITGVEVLEDDDRDCIDEVTDDE